MHITEGCFSRMGGQEGTTFGPAFCVQELLLRAECCNMALDQIVVRGCEDVPGRFLVHESQRFPIESFQKESSRPPVR